MSAYTDIEKSAKTHVNRFQSASPKISLYRYFDKQRASFKHRIPYILKHMGGQQFSVLHVSKKIFLIYSVIIRVSFYPCVNTCISLCTCWHSPIPDILPDHSPVRKSACGERVQQTGTHSSTVALCTVVLW